MNLNMAKPFRPNPVGTWVRALTSVVIARREECSARLAFSAHRRHCAGCAATTFASVSILAALILQKHLEPTRRVELPLDGLRDRYTSVVLRGRRSKRCFDVEPAIGVEPTCPCVAHRAVTWTHRLGGAATEQLIMQSRRSWA